MPDLRTRLVESDGFGDALSELRADRALAVFAAWLRERADEDPNEGTPITLRALADEIDPREASDEQ